MRVTDLLRKLIGLDHTRVISAEFGDDGIVIDVAPTWQACRCSGCGETCTGYDQRERRWRHLDLGGMKCEPRYSLRRAECAQCGVRVEQVPWAECESGFTKPLEEFVAVMAQKADKTTVIGLMRIAWYTVGRIIERATRRLGGDPLAQLHGLRRIGIDELSYEKHHTYVTVVTDHDRGCVVWVAPGRSAVALDAFFDALGPDGVAALEFVSIDMSAPFKKALSDRAPHVQVVFDRLHVQRLIHEALDEVRRSLVREAEKPEEKKALEKTRFTLHRAPWNLDAIARRRLAELEADNQPLFQAHLMKESLVAIIDAVTPDDIHDLLMDWLRWIDLEASPPFIKAPNTIAEHFDDICAYIHTGQTNAHRGTQPKDPRRHVRTGEILC